MLAIDFPSSSTSTSTSVWSPLKVRLSLAPRADNLLENVRREGDGETEVCRSAIMVWAGLRRVLAGWERVGGKVFESQRLISIMLSQMRWRVRYSGVSSSAEFVM